MLTIPAFGAAADKDGNTQGAVVGVLQIANKISGKFDDDDVNFMNKFLSIVGPILEQSSLFQQQKTTVDTA